MNETMIQVGISLDTLDSITICGIKDIYRLAKDYECTQECLAALVLLEYMLSISDYNAFLDKLNKEGTGTDEK